MTDLDTGRFDPDTSGPTALFLDTSGLFAYFHPRADEHEEARAFLQRVAEGEFPYRPLYTDTYVLDELLTLLASKASHETAREALDRITESDDIRLQYESDDLFERALETFRQREQAVSFTDCTIREHMRAAAVDHVFAYDGDFETFGLTVVPR